MKLNIHNLKKIFSGNHVVFDDINLQVDNAHSITILGPSGGGKTTLLRILAGLETPTGGTISINDHVIPYVLTIPPDHSKDLRVYRSKIGMVFQNYNLFPHLTSLQNITLPLEKVHNIPPEEARERAENLFKRFRLVKHSHKKPFQLSGGQKQRIAISRAIAIQPEFLLFDEPTSALDPDFTSEVLDMIEELKGETDIIIVTHNMGFAHHVSDHILFVAEGGILASTSPDEMFNNTSHPYIHAFFKKILKY